MHRKARRLALAEAPILFFSVVLCWQNVKIHECLLGMPNFQCIGAGSVPPPISCRTLGRAARRKARHLALAEAPILFFSVVLCWQNFKICEYLLAMPSFQCIGGGSVPPPMPCRTLGRAARQKARPLALAEGPNLFSLSYCVGKTLKCVNVCLQRPVFNALGVAVCRPQLVAGRWAGRRAKRRVTWPWRRRRFSFSLSYCVAKTLNSVNFCLQCLVFIASGVAVCHPRCLARHWAGRHAERRIAWPSRKRRFFFSLSYCVGKTLKSVNVCLQRPVFNASGPAVCRPQSVAGRWAGRRAERRVAWPWRRPECNFLSCFGRIICGKMRCRGKTGVAMQCTASRLQTL